MKTCLLVDHRYFKICQVWEQAVAYSDKLIVNSLIPKVFSDRVTSLLNGAGLELVPALINMVVLAIILIGFARSLRQLNIWDLYVGFYFAGILLFRNPVMGVAQPRFLVPLIPFFYYYLILGALWLANLIFGSNDRRILIVVSSLPPW